MTGYYWDSAAKDNCVLKAADCKANYATEAGDETAGTATTGAHCTSCATGFFFTSTANDECGTACKDNFWSAEGD
jgi:hypothetical protein